MGSSLNIHDTSMVAPAEIPRSMPVAELLNATQAAALMGRSARWVRDNREELPFARKIGRGWVYSRIGIMRFAEGENCTVIVP